MSRGASCKSLRGFDHTVMEESFLNGETKQKFRRQNDDNLHFCLDVIQLATTYDVAHLAFQFLKRKKWLGCLKKFLNTCKGSASFMFLKYFFWNTCYQFKYVFLVMTLINKRNKSLLTSYALVTLLRIFMRDSDVSKMKRE